MSIANRRDEVVDTARAAIADAFGDGATDVVTVSDGAVTETDRAAWPPVARALPPSQEPTPPAAVAFAVRQALARHDGPVIVLSDRAIDVGDARTVQIAPTKPLDNVAVTRFAIRESSAGGAQAMVTVANRSDQRRATLRVRSGDAQHVVERTIDLPRRGGEANVFVDLPAIEATAVAEVDAPGDEIAVDNIAHAKRQHPYPTIEVRAAVPAEVRRVAEAYAKTRPPTETSPRVAVVSDDHIPDEVSAAIVATSSSTFGAGAVQVAAHPVTAGVDWADAKAQAIGVPPGQGWRALVTIADHPAVAVRESPRRQVWVGLDAPDFPRTADFVIFWTNVFDWLATREEASGGGAATWVSSVVPPIDTSPAPATDWRSKLQRLSMRNTPGTDVTSIALLASVICLILAGFAWPRRSLTPFSTPLTV
jgi:hypothetical protein